MTKEDKREKNIPMWIAIFIIAALSVFLLIYILSSCSFNSAIHFMGFGFAVKSALVFGLGGLIYSGFLGLLWAIAHLVSDRKYDSRFSSQFDIDSYGRTFLIAGFGSAGILWLLTVFDLAILTL